jgi:general secretion pathway protein F
VVNASIYPAVLLAVGSLVTIFLLAYVVPRFAHVYEERGGDLPMFSKLLIGWGKAVDAHGVLVLGTVIGLVALAIYAVRRPEVRARFAELAWRIPAVQGRLQLYQLSRFYRTVGMLLRGGLPLVTALEMAGELLHPLFRTRLATATQAIAEGHGVSQSMEANGLTTPVALRMLAVGEKSGNMGEMLESIAVFHDEELARWVDWFTRLFEPILMAIIGLIIGVIVILMYMPIFELAGNLQ